MIKVENLTKRFGRVVAVDGITFEARRGEVLGFLGPNGAGKSTTMKMIVGLTVPTSGCITVDGHDSQRESLAVRRLIGHLPEGTPIYGDMRVRAFLDFVAEVKGIGRSSRAAAVDQAIRECGLEEMQGRLIRHLSKGYRQRTGLAQAVLGDPPVLILDEPTVGLDPGQIIEIRHLIRGMAGKRTVLISTHILPEVEVTCDRVIIIREGRLVAEGTPSRLAGDSGVLRVRLGAAHANVKSQIAALASVKDCDVVKEEGDVVVAVRGENVGAMRREILACVQKNHWDLIELTAKTRGLEQVFLEAVGQEVAP